VVSDGDVCHDASPFELMEFEREQENKTDAGSIVTCRTVIRTSPSTRRRCRMRNATASAMVTDAVAADFPTGKAHTAYLYSPHAG